MKAAIRGMIKRKKKEDSFEEVSEEIIKESEGTSKWRNILEELRI